MAPEQKTLQQVVEFARHLTPREKAQLIAQIIPDVEATLIRKSGFAGAPSTGFATIGDVAALGVGKNCGSSA